jgi:hypothetical protein
MDTYTEEKRLSFRRITAGIAVCGGVLFGLATPAFAHDCFNPKKPAGAGVNYTVVGFNDDGPIFEQTGNGKGIGGFATINLSAFGGPDVNVDVHTIGHSGSHEVVGGPGSQDPARACDGRGIDYIEACFAG